MPTSTRGLSLAQQLSCQFIQRRLGCDLCPGDELPTKQCTANSLGQLVLGGLADAKVVVIQKPTEFGRRPLCKTSRQQLLDLGSLGFGGRAGRV